jgi:hypothetical protein
MTDAPTSLAEIEKLLAAIRKYPDPRRAAEEWKRAYRLLQKTPLPADRVSGVIGMRDAEGLAALIEELRHPVAAAPSDAPAAEVCAKALQAFRKRFALAVLDEESKLGRNPLTKGAESSIAGIAPPADWPEPVWRELVRQGQLRYVGHGLYAPVNF